MENHWTQGYQAGKAGLDMDQSQPVAWHFGFDQGRKDWNRQALRVLLGEARGTPAN